MSVCRISSEKVCTSHVAFNLLDDPAFINGSTTIDIVSAAFLLTI